MPMSEGQALQADGGDPVVIAPSGEAPAAAPAAPPVQGEQNNAEQAPAPSGEKPATDDAPDDPARKSRRFEKRIDAANRKYGQEKARADFLAAEVERLKPRPAPAVTGAPTLEQHNFDAEAYATAKAEFIAEQRVREFQTKQQQSQAQTAAQRISEGWQAQAADAEDKWEDFHEVVGELQPVNALTAAIMRAGTAVAYHLGKNPAEAQALAKMEPLDQLVAVGELKAKLLAAPPVVKQPSKAPAPITPVTGKAPVVDDGIQSDDMKVFMRARNKQLGRKTG